MVKMQKQRERDAATRMQRAWRERLVVYKLFGHELFVRDNDRLASYGKLHFPGESNTLLGPQRFLVCSNKTSARTLAGFLARGPWHLERPGLLIVVNGGAQNFKLEPPRLARLFNQGVADAARDARAVVTAAGTDAGVSKLVASAMEKGNIKQAVIGFAPFGRILGGKELLGKVEGGSVAYSHLPANKDKGQAAPLNPDHTHFILVESPGNEWGSESKLRAELEAEYAQRMKVPIVGLAVQGGPGTVQMLYENALRQTPCVVVAQSGGASTELWEYFKSDQRGAPELPRFPSGHKHAGKPKYQVSPTLNWFAEILKRHKECGGLLVIFYDIDGEVEDLSHCLLKAVVDFKLLDFKTRKAAAIGQGGTALQALETEAAQVDGALDQALDLATKWDRLSVAKGILDELGGMRQAFPDGAGSAPAVQGALELAVEMGRTDFVSLLLHLPGIKLADVNMMRLCATHRLTVCSVSRIWQHDLDQ